MGGECPRGSGAGTALTRSAAQYCFDLVREQDKDRFLSTLFAPDELRPHLLALYAFNIEIARVRDAVREPVLGELRHQWWREALDALYGHEPCDHPVAEALKAAIAHGGLPKQALKNMIEARRFDLYDDPMPTLNHLEGYLGETSSALIQMAALILAGRDAATAAEVAGLAGVAYGLTGLLRSLPLHRARGQCYLPRDVLERHGSAPAHLLSARNEPALGAALAELRQVAQRRLEESRAGLRFIPQRALPAFLPVSLTDLYLARLVQLGTKALAQVAEVSQLRRQWRLYGQARRAAF